MFRSVISKAVLPPTPPVMTQDRSNRIAPFSGWVWPGSGLEEALNGKFLRTPKFTLLSQMFCKRLPSHTGQKQACARITWLVVRSFFCHHAENGPIHMKMVVDCPIVITSIDDTLLLTRSDQEWGVIGQASLLHSWHWVLLASHCNNRENLFF